MTTNLALRAGRDISYHTSRMGGAVGAVAYYTGANGEPSGQWAGKGAERLGLTGAVDPGVLHRLFHQHISPDGDRLTPVRSSKQDRDVDDAVAAWRVHHPFASGTEVAEFRASQMAKTSVARPYFDFAIGTVKSASLLQASLVISAKKAREAGGLEAAAELQADADAIEDAILGTARVLVEEIEKVAAFTRTGHHSATSGEWRDADGVTAAIFVQHTSHEGDPHLHAHVTVMNLVQRADGADGKHRTMDSRQLYANRLRLAAVADRDMETRLTALGWPMEMRPDGNGAEVMGVGEDLAEMFSSRRVAMKPEIQALADEYTAKHGHAPNQRALWLLKQFVSMKQRKASGGSHASPAELLAEWERQTTDSEVLALGGVHERVRATAGGATAVLDQAAKLKCARVAVAEVQKHHAVFGANELRFEIHRALPVLRAGTDHRALIDEIASLATSGRCGADAVIATAADITNVTELGARESDGGSIFRPPNEDRWTTLRHLDVEGRIIEDAKRPVPQLVPVAEAKAAVAMTDLNPEQADAVIMMLTSATGTVALQAAAGSGKTRAVAEFSRLWTELTGGRVIGLTTSTNAARVMELEAALAGAPMEAYNSAQFLGRVKGSDELRYPVAIGLRDVLVLDEATQLSTTDWALIQAAARAAGARTAGVGDTFQLGAVGAGGVFRLVAQEVPSTELHEVMRFRNEWEGPASVKLREGDFGVYADYDRRGRMSGADHEVAYDQAVGSWLANHLDGKLSLLLAGSNAEAAELSRRAQERLVKLGTVTEPRAALSDGNAAGVGDLIRARLNSTITAGGRLLTNRDTLRVTSWNGRDAEAQRRELDGSWSPEFILPGSYMADSCELDYAGNTHVGQGRTVDTGHLLVSETLDRAGFYVGMTRGREGNHAHIVTGDSAPEGRAPYEQASPESVVKSVLRRDDADLSATEQIRNSMEWASGTGHLLTLWAESVRPSVNPDIDSAFRANLSDAEYWRYEREFSREVLINVLRERQMRGQNPVALIEQITAAPMDGARSVASVLHGRLADLAMPDDQAALWVERTPASAPAVAHELADGLDARISELGERSVTEPQPWLLAHLGVLAPDASSVLRAEYTRRAGIAAGYREAAGIHDPHQAVALVPHRDRPELEAMRQAAVRSLEITLEQLGELPRGELEARVLEGKRVMAAAPADVSGKLRAAATAEADARRQAAEREVEHDAQGAENARQHAALMAQAKAPLEMRNAQYETWSGATAEVRGKAGEAQAELARRGLEEPEQEQTSSSWWAEFEKDLEEVDRALSAEREAAEADGKTWPPKAEAVPVTGSPALQDLAAWSARLDEAQDKAAMAAAAVAAERAQAQEDAEYAARVEREAQAEPEAQAEQEME